jgi:hypothetical protein
MINYLNKLSFDIFMKKEYVAPMIREVDELAAPTAMMMSQPAE